MLVFNLCKKRSFFFEFYFLNLLKKKIFYAQKKKNLRYLYMVVHESVNR